MELVIIGLVATLWAIDYFFDWFHKMVPWVAKGNNGLKIWAVIFFVIVPLLAILVSNRA